MKVSKLILLTGVLSIVTVASLTSNVFAWHPKGVIVKKVQNITSNSVLSDADTTLTAVAAKPGDIMKYVIEVRNDGTPDSRGWNDMAKTVMTDTLPAGVTLVANPAQRQITENIGLITPGQKVVKEYTVKVTATSNSTIHNKACFTGDSAANDNPQQGCNPAVITVTVPPVVPEPPVVPQPPVTPPVTPPTTPPVVTPLELPQTGPAENILTSVLAIGAGWYAAHRYIQSKRDLKSALIVRR